MGPLLEEVVANFDSRGFPGVVGVLLERSAQDAHLLVLDVEVEGFKDAFEELLLSVFVHVDDCPPVVGDFVEALDLGQVGEGQDILLEAAAAEAHAAVQELVADSTVSRDAGLDLLHVCLVLLAKDGDAVDGTHPLG